MGGLGAVGASSIFGLVRRAGAFTGGLLTFVLVSGLQITQINCDTYHFFRTVSSLRLESMVGDVLTRTSTLRIDLGVGRVIISSGSCTSIVFV